MEEVARLRIILKFDTAYISFQYTHAYFEVFERSIVEATEMDLKGSKKKYEGLT